MDNYNEMSFDEKLKKVFGDMIVYKSVRRTKMFSALNIPGYMRDWIVMRFSDDEGNIDDESVSAYIKRVIPGKQQWNNYMVDMLYNNKTVRFLARLVIEFDMKTKKAIFRLPELSVPAHKGDAVVPWSVVEKNRDYFFTPTDVWGIVELTVEMDKNGKSILMLKDFTPFCPYKVDLSYYVKARELFSLEEWIDLIIGAIDYSSLNYGSVEQKLSMLKRLLPFVEGNINLIELAPKETGKSYLFSQISQYSWLISGGSVSRAKLFFDINKKTNGLVSRYDVVAFDEINTMHFTDPLEISGALKGYLESGNYFVGDHHGTGNAGLMLLGNIPAEFMNVNSDLTETLPDIFHDSAMLDRFHGFIEGWKIPKMREALKADGFAFNTEYFSEMLHQLRTETVYRSVIDKLLIVPGSASARDTEAIKRLSTAYLKLLFPNVRSEHDIDPVVFEEYCLAPAKHMRGIIKRQLSIIDPLEFKSAEVADIQVRRY